MFNDKNLRANVTVDLSSRPEKFSIDRNPPEESPFRNTLRGTVPNMASRSPDSSAEMTASIAASPVRVPFGW